MATLMTIDQQAPASVSFTDRLGNAARVDGSPVWTSSDTNVAEVIPGDDGFSALIRAVNIGVAQIVAKADADLDEGETREVFAVGDIQVVAGEAVGAAVVVGAVEAKPADVPAPAPVDPAPAPADPAPADAVTP